MSHLCIALLGGFEVLLDGRPITAFGTDKVRGLLAYLAVEAGHPHRRAALAAMFWPDLPAERAGQNLRQSLLLLRRALGETDAPPDPARQPFLLLGRQEIQFNPLSDYRLDASSFLELIRAARQHPHVTTTGCGACIGWLREAVNLYRGDLLAGFAPRDSMPFEEWQLVQQEALHGQALEALGLLADYHERRGEPAQVVEYARRLLALEPWQERAHLQVMAALEQSGQGAAALEQYASYSRIVSQEFGMLPSAAAAALHDQIRARLAAGDRQADAARSDGRPAEGPAAVAPRDERRPVTALICRRHLGDVDPEELHEQVARCGELCAPILARFGGLRQPRQGADCLTYFGYPVAQEDAARRAVSAALAIVEAARAADSLHIGIHSGTMVSAGGGLVGNVPDLARDCMRLAAPGAVKITAETERLVRGWFDCYPAGEPGSLQQSLLYEVHGESRPQNRLDRLARARTLPPLAGRKRELEQMIACLRDAQRGRGRVITLSGEPGIGKSRLAWELKQAQAAPVRWLESRCLPFFQNTSLRPVIGLIETACGFEPDDAPDVKRDKLIRALAACDLAQPAAISLLSLLLGLPTLEPAPQTITEDQRERMREVLVTYLQREAARGPLVLLIEDLHWADPTTIGWLGRSLDAFAAARCVVLLTWRPEFVAPWLLRGHVLALELGPLSSAEAAHLVAGVAGSVALPEPVRQQIVQQTDGVPLFVEELTRTVVETPALAGAAGGAGLQVPATLADSLAAHLDRAGPAKETAQWAAALGREFSYPLLRAVAPYGEARVQADLAALLAADLVSQEGEASRATYAFKHALLQEAAYGSLLKRSRQDCHRRIAETLAHDFPEIAETQPETLAQHYDRAGLATQAADCWSLAGERALAQGATQEARTFFDRALAKTAPCDPARRWRALLGREAAFGLREERDAQRADLDELLALADALADDVRRLQVYDRQAMYAARVADFPLGLAAAEAAWQAAARTRDAALELSALVNKVQALCNLSQLDAAGAVVEQALAKAAAVEDGAAKGYALAGLSMYYSHRGDFSRALKLQLVVADMIRRAGQRMETARLLANIGLHYSQLGKYAEARAAHEEGLALAEAIGDQHSQTMHRWNLCYVLWCQGDPAAGRAQGEVALAQVKTVGQNRNALATCLGHLGCLAEDTGDLATAAAHLSEARRLYAETRFIGPLMELQAVEARCLLGLGRPADAVRLAEEVWAHQLAHGLVMFDYPGRVFACIADVMAAVATPPVPARTVLEAGYRALMSSAEMIEDPDWRRSFLEVERSNQDLLVRWRARAG